MITCQFYPPLSLASISICVISWQMPGRLPDSTYFIIIYNFARYSCIACIVLLKPRSPRSCFLGYFWNNSNKKFLALPAFDIHSWNLSNCYFPMFHICQIIRRHFSLRQVKLYIGQRKEWPTDWANDQASEFALTQLTPTSHSAKWPYILPTNFAILRKPFRLFLTVEARISKLCLEHNYKFAM